MQSPSTVSLPLILAALLIGAGTARCAEAGTTPAAPARPRADAQGNPLRYAATGHVSNYDEAKAAHSALPDPLVLQNGKPVRDAATWLQQRRPELIAIYEREIYGRVPTRAPRMTWTVAETEAGALGGTAVRKRIVGMMGTGADAPKVNVTLYLPARARGPVPVLLHVTFFTTDANPPPPAPPATDGKAARPRTSEAGPLADILARGYGYAFLRYTEIQADNATTSQGGVHAQAYAPGQTKPAPDEWGTIAAWAWGASRALDYFETDPAVDAKRVALIGHSRLGKTALWAGARDPRFALMFASCSGEMGASLARRDFGETIDDVAANFPWWHVPGFAKYAGRWNEMPVDAHTLIALSAPRPVFITGGTQDLWADPRGMFLAAVAAGPVYRLLGKKDLGVTEGPPLDTPLITGSLGFHYHSGGHTISPEDWRAFLTFADLHLQPKP
jgi:hypothetical protein